MKTYEVASILSWVSFGTQKLLNVTLICQVKNAEVIIFTIFLNSEYAAQTADAHFHMVPLRGFEVPSVVPSFTQVYCAFLRKQKLFIIIRFNSKDLDQSEQGFCYPLKNPNITKTCLFKHTKNFTTKK